jgi:hypothetical protein
MASEENSKTEATELFSSGLPSGVVAMPNSDNDTGIPASGPRGPVARWKASDQDHTQSRNRKP